MLRTLLKSKIHRATVTDANLNYVGSVTIDETLMEAADLLEHEQVDVLNITNGKRLTTYVLRGPRNSGIIQINGAAAHLVSSGDLVIIASYATYSEEELRQHHPKVVLVNERNQPCSVNEATQSAGSTS